jgi:hypothetical protein
MVVTALNTQHSQQQQLVPTQDLKNEAQILLPQCYQDLKNEA